MEEERQDKPPESADDTPPPRAAIIDKESKRLHHRDWRKQLRGISPLAAAIITLQVQILPVPTDVKKELVE